MTLPKKPEKPTDEKIRAAAAKRKNVMRTETEALPTGNLEQITKKITAFAENVGVPVEDVRIVGGWSCRMQTRRTETDEEKFKRVKGEYMDRYENSMYEYRRKLREAEDAARRLAYLQQQVGNKNCCPSNCCCRRGKDSC